MKHFKFSGTDCREELILGPIVTSFQKWSIEELSNVYELISVMLSDQKRFLLSDPNGHPNLLTRSDSERLRL